MALRPRQVGNIDAGKAVSVLGNRTNRDFLRDVFVLAMPMSLQNFVMSAVNLVDVAMVGSLGDDAVAATGVANQIFFVYMLVNFGVFSGATVFLAQYWGKQDTPNLHRTMGYMFTVSVPVGLFFAAASQAFPARLLALYTRDASVIADGVPYLRWISVTFLLHAVTFGYAVTCRSTGQVRLPLAGSFAAVGTNILFNWLLIFGKMGFPQLGIRGAAIATALSRLAECLIIIPTVYLRKLPAAAKPSAMFRYDREFTRRFVRTCVPVIVNESLWGIGTSMFTGIYALLGTAALAATQVVGAVSNLFMIFARGFSNAAAVLIGRKIGAGDEGGAKGYAARFPFLMIVSGLLMGALLLALRGPLLTLYDISEQAIESAMILMLMNAALMAPRYLNSCFIVGIFRAGGDTLFAGFLDVLPVWLSSIPLGLLGVRMGWPLAAVFLLVTSDEFFKLVVSVPRLLSWKWIHNVTTKG